MFLLNLVAGVEGLEGVGESLVVAEGGEGGGVVHPAAHAPVPVPDERVRHHQGDVVRVHPSASWRTHLHQKTIFLHLPE